MFNVEDVAVDHYVDWDWRLVLVVIAAGLLLAGFSFWSSPERSPDSVLLLIVSYGFPLLLQLPVFGWGLRGLSRGAWLAGSTCFSLCSWWVRFCAVIGMRGCGGFVP